MKIVSVDRVECMFVETDEHEQFSYIRYAPDDWYVRYGESYEPVYGCEEIESLFQNHK